MVEVARDVRAIMTGQDKKPSAPGLREPELREPKKIGLIDTLWSGSVFYLKWKDG